MQSQTTNSRAKMLGPFLTLILSSPERGRVRVSPSSRHRPGVRPRTTAPPPRETKHSTRPSLPPAATETGTDPDADFDFRREPVRGSAGTRSEGLAGGGI